MKHDNEMDANESSQQRKGIGDVVVVVEEKVRREKGRRRGGGGGTGNAKSEVRQELRQGALSRIDGR